MCDSSITLTIISIMVTGGLSTTATVIAMKVHIGHILKRLDKQDESITRAHVRIDTIKQSP